MKKIVYKLTKDNGIFMILENLPELFNEISFFDDLEPGDVIDWKIECIEMTNEEIKALPDFDGF